MYVDNIRGHRRKSSSRGKVGANAPARKPCMRQNKA